MSKDWVGDRRLPIGFDEPSFRHFLAGLPLGNLKKMLEHLRRNEDIMRWRAGIVEEIIKQKEGENPV